MALIHSCCLKKKMPFYVYTFLIDILFFSTNKQEICSSCSSCTSSSADESDESVTDSSSTDSSSDYSLRRQKARAKFRCGKLCDISL